MTMKNTLMFPRRGDPPPDQPGYEREEGDPYVFHLKWADCAQRYSSKKCGGCGSSDRGMPWCALLDVPVDRVTCHCCDKRELPQVRRECQVEDGTFTVKLTRRA